MNKQVVVLKLSNLSVPQKIEKARYIVTSMTGNANFPTPSPTLSTITTNANDLETAYVAAQGGGKDDRANMYAKEYLLDLSLKSLAAYVEGIANADPINAEAIILSAGMDVKTPGGSTSNDFSISATGNPGEMKLAAKFVERATFIFQMTTEPDKDSTWVTIGQSTRSKMVKDDLQSGTRYYFRTAAVDKNGQGPWSNVLNAIAL